MERAAVAGNEVVQAVQVGYVQDLDIDTEAVVFAFENGETLEIQGNVIADEPYCVASNFRGASYDGVEYWSVDGAEFTLGLSQGVADSLEYPRVLKIAAPSEELAAVESHVESILGMPAVP